MRKVLAVCLFISIFCYLDAQHTIHKMWDKRYGGSRSDYFQNLHQTKDKGYIFCGFSNSGINGDKTQANWDTSKTCYNFWIVKVDSEGTKQWDKRFGGNLSEFASELVETTDGGYIIAGESHSGISGNKTSPSRGGADFWILKIDALGNYQWDKRFGGQFDDGPLKILQTLDGGYFIGGVSNSNVSGDKTQPNWDVTNWHSDFWVVKTDSAGNKQWDKRYGGTNEDALTCVIQNSDGSYVLGGPSLSDSSGDKTRNLRSGASDYWIIKIDSIGNKIWDKNYGGPGDNYLQTIVSMENGELILGGISTSSIGIDKSQASLDGIHDYWILKVDSTGNKLWDKAYGGAGTNDFANICRTLDGGFLLSGRTDAQKSGNKSENNMGGFQIWVVKTDSLGSIQWDKTILTSGYDAGYAIQSADGCYIIGAESPSGIGGYKSQPNWDSTEATYDYWLVKFCDTLITGINEITTGAQIIVSPNPFTTDIAISLQKENLKEASFTIYNMLGQAVYTRKETNLSPSYTKMLNLSYLPNGFYFVEVVLDGEKVVKQIIKQ